MTVATPAVFAGSPSRPAGRDVLAPLDTGRIAANAMAVCVHVVAGLLLMAPLAMPDWKAPLPSTHPIRRPCRRRPVPFRLRCSVPSSGTRRWS